MFKKNLITTVIFLLCVNFSSIALAKIPTSIYDLLDYYNYSTKEQKTAFQNLLHLSKLLPQNQSLQDFYKEKLNKILLLEDLLSLVSYFHSDFVMRNNAKERWQIKTAPDWTKQNKLQIFQDATTLGFVNKQLPTIKEADAICILGATKGTIENRLNYAIKLINDGLLSTKYIILLAGERYTEVGIDGTEEELKIIANYYGIKDIKSLTETHLIKYLYEHSSIANKFSLLVVDQPKNELTRPTTETTIIGLLNLIKQHPDIKNLVFVSNQPYVLYQDTVIERTINNTVSQITKFETIGDELQAKSLLSSLPLSDQKTEDQITERTIISLIEAISSYMFAKTPFVISKLNLKASDISTAIKEKLYNLYANNKLVYHNISLLFEKELIDK